MRVVRVSRTEFELENGQVFPIDPPLGEEMTPDEFQEHYDFAAAVVQGRCLARSDHKDAPVMGQSGHGKNDS